MAKNQQPFYWYFVNKIFLVKNQLRISLVNNQQNVKTRLFSNNLKQHFNNDVLQFVVLTFGVKVKCCSSSAQINSENSQ